MGAETKHAEGDAALLRDAAMAAHAVLAGISGNLLRQPKDVLADADSRVQLARDYLRAGIQGTLHPLSEDERAFTESKLEASS
jgi:hypothetical protein